MRRTPIVVFLVFAALLPQGCGTALNLASGEPSNFGGVQKDFEILRGMESQPLFKNDQQANQGEAIIYVFVLAWIPTELCLSVMGDTFTLPLVMYWHHRHDAPEKESVPASPAAALDLAASTR